MQQSRIQSNNIAETDDEWSKTDEKIAPISCKSLVIKFSGFIIRYRNIHIMINT